MEDKEKTIGRVVGFLYDALDNFKSTMDDVNASVSTLMSSLTKIEKDLQTLGVQPKHSAPMSSSQLAARIKASSSTSSRERLIGLLTGKPIASTLTSATPVSKATPAISVSKPVSTPTPPKPMVGPPKAGPPRASSSKPMVGPPKSVKLPTKATTPIKIAAPPAKMAPPAIGKPTTPIKPPTVPTIKPPPATGPRPPIMKPPTVAAKPMASPAAAGPKPGGSSIIGLRDEMLKELKRLKSIMKGG
ncbi:MAG: hypothetical protein ACTSRG_05550 [Candidatus Helarchaeota archaeon]